MREDFYDIFKSFNSGINAFIDYLYTSLTLLFGTEKSIVNNSNITS